MATIIDTPNGPVRLEQARPDPKGFTGRSTGPDSFDKQFIVEQRDPHFNAGTPQEKRPAPYKPDPVLPPPPTPRRAGSGISEAEALAAVADLRAAGVSEDRIRAALALEELTYTPPAAAGQAPTAGKAAATKTGEYMLNFTGVDTRPLEADVHSLNKSLPAIFAAASVPPIVANAFLAAMTSGAKAYSALENDAARELHSRTEVYRAEQVLPGAAGKAKAGIDRARTANPELVSRLEKRGAFTSVGAIVALARHNHQHGDQP
jgi:hypothetical protein